MHDFDCFHHANHIHVLFIALNILASKLFWLNILNVERMRTISNRTATQRIKLAETNLEIKWVDRNYFFCFFFQILFSPQNSSKTFYIPNTRNHVVFFFFYSEKEKRSKLNAIEKRLVMLSYCGLRCVIIFHWNWSRWLNNVVTFHQLTWYICLIHVFNS